ncbi:MAG: B12-binding domain-containing radical SAM protein [Akkermansiaceae bacterium]|nr:B12-binding domain-containing radical SAM protein [Akkermansiaceae bacterium]
MKILLMDNLVMPEEGSLATMDIHPHLGLLALAAAAESQGHSIKIIDPKRAIRWREWEYDSTLYQRAAAEVLAYGPDALGFTTLGCSFLFALNVAQIVKFHQPELPILLGGPHATMLHKQILGKFPQFDIVVRHEADEIFARVLDNLETRAFEKIPGISWRPLEKSPELRFTDGKPIVQDLDSLPIASYDHYPVKDLGLDLLRIEAGRGCPFHCTFCSTASFFQRSFRLKSADRLVQELDILHERYGYSDFKLDHDLFTVNRRKVMEFCEAVNGRGYRWRASARIDCVDKELLTRMAESGCVSLYFGIETGSVRMQQVCQKRLNLDLVEPTLQHADRLGIDITASFITGFPEELPEDQNDTLDMLGKFFSPTCLPQLHMLAPEPGTPLFDKLGETVKYDGYAGRYNAMLVAEHDEDLVVENPEIFQTYYYFPATMPRDRIIFAVEAVELLRRAGPVVLKYMLRAYEGRLSNLVGDLREFCESNGKLSQPEAGMIEEFVRWRFGVAHHLTSIFRYALRSGDAIMEPVREPLQAGTPFDPDRLYQASAAIHVLYDLHDCNEVVDQIRRVGSEALLDNSYIANCGVYLLEIASGSSQMFQINEGIAAIIELFEQPRSCNDVMGMILRSAGLSSLDMDFFADLASRRIIVPVSFSGAVDTKSTIAIHE